MKLLHSIDALDALPAGSVAVIGNFDGVHVGHQKLLRLARDSAAGRSLVVVSFEPHPLTVLRPELSPPVLTPLRIKTELLASLGVNQMILLRPEPAILKLAAHDFYRLLVDRGRVAHLVEGSDFSFGAGRSGTIENLREWTAADSIKLTVVEPVEVTLTDGSIVPARSTLVRWLLFRGRVADAARCLGRPFELLGTVVAGERRGRTIGFPTANLDCGTQIVPAEGVYAGVLHVDDRRFPAAVSVGTKPTFGVDQVTVEAHLLDASIDLYDKTVRLELHAWVRDQYRFPGVDALKSQLARDIAAVRSLLDAQKALRPSA